MYVFRCFLCFSISKEHLMGALIFACLSVSQSHLSAKIMLPYIGGPVNYMFLRWELLLGFHMEVWRFFLEASSNSYVLISYRQLYLMLSLPLMQLVLPTLQMLKVMRWEDDYLWWHHYTLCWYVSDIMNCWCCILLVCVPHCAHLSVCLCHASADCAAICQWLCEPSVLPSVIDHTNYLCGNQSVAWLPTNMYWSIMLPW